jgi:hypothetical protein
LLFIVPGELAVIIDYKFGEFWTEPPQYNWQLKAYGYGAFKMFGGKGVRLIKLQPELPEEYRYMSHLIWTDDIEKIGVEIKAVVDKTTDENAPLVRGEKQCQFCKAKETCPLHRGTVLSIPQHVSIASHLNNISPVERGKLFDNLTVLKKWVEKAIATIETIALNNGIDIEGYEIGHGRGSREWDDPVSALLSMKELARECGIPNDRLTVPETVISPAEADKVFGKAKKIQTFLSALYTTVDGKLKLKKVKDKNEKSD